MALETIDVIEKDDVDRLERHPVGGLGDDDHPRPSPSAVRSDGCFYLAYRLRRPVGDGRGYAVVIAQSTDGVALETIDVIEKDDVGGLGDDDRVATPVAHRVRRSR